MPWTVCSTTVSISTPNATSNRICSNTTTVSANPPINTLFARVSVTRISINGLFDSAAKNAFVAAVQALLNPVTAVKSVSIGTLTVGSRRRSIYYYSFDYTVQVPAPVDNVQLDALLSNITLFLSQLASAGISYDTIAFSSSTMTSLTVRLTDSSGNNPLQSSAGTTTPAPHFSDSSLSTTAIILIVLGSIAVIVAFVLFIIYRRKKKQYNYEKAHPSTPAFVSAPNSPRSSAQPLRMSETTETQVDLLPTRSFRHLGSYRATNKRESNPVIGKRGEQNRATIWQKPAKAEQAGPSTKFGEDEEEVMDSMKFVSAPPQQQQTFTLPGHRGSVTIVDDE